MPKLFITKLAIYYSIWWLIFWHFFFLLCGFIPLLKKSLNLYFMLICYSVFLRNIYSILILIGSLKQGKIKFINGKRSFINGKNSFINMRKKDPHNEILFHWWEKYFIRGNSYFINMGKHLIYPPYLPTNFLYKKI